MHLGLHPYDATEDAHDHLNFHLAVCIYATRGPSTFMDLPSLSRRPRGPSGFLRHSALWWRHSPLPTYQTQDFWEINPNIRDTLVFVFTFIYTLILQFCMYIDRPAHFLIPSRRGRWYNRRAYDDGDDGDGDGGGGS